MLSFVINQCSWLLYHNKLGIRKKQLCIYFSCSTLSGYPIHGNDRRFNDITCFFTKKCYMTIDNSWELEQISQIVWKQVRFSSFQESFFFTISQKKNSAPYIKFHRIHLFYNLLYWYSTMPNKPSSIKAIVG